MKINRKEFLVFFSGIITLGGLIGNLFHRRVKTPSQIVSIDDGFVLPEIAVNVVHRSDGRIYQIDRDRKTVCAYNETNGEQIWESHGEDRFIVPGASFPIDLSVDRELWVANVGRKRLEQLDPETGRFIALWEPQKPFGGCCNPVRFAILSGGRIVTMEKGTRKVCIYEPSGAVERIVTEELSDSEFNYYLVRIGETIYIYDTQLRKQWEVM